MSGRIFKLIPQRFASRGLLLGIATLAGVKGCLDTGPISFFSYTIKCDNFASDNKLIFADSTLKNVHEYHQNENEENFLEPLDEEIQKNPISFFWREWVFPDFWIIIFSGVFTVVATMYRPSVKTLLSCVKDGGLISFKAMGKLVSSIGLSCLATFGANCFLTLACDRFLRRARVSIFKKLIEQDISFYNPKRIHELISMLNVEMILARSNLKQFISSSILTATQTIISVYEMFMISRGITLFSVVVLFPGIYGIGALGQQSLKRLRGFVRQAESAFAMQVKQTFDHVKTVKATNAEPFELQMVKDNCDNIFSHATIFNLGLSSFLALSNLTVSGLGIGLVTALYLSSRKASENMGGDVVVFAQFLESLANLQRAFGNFGSLLSIWSKLGESAQTLAKYMHKQAQIENPFSSDAVNNIRTISRIDFRNVSFRYPLTKDLALRDTTISLEHGKVVAIVGTSGSGKSTFASLLERFYDPNDGEILVDGVKLKDINISSWRRSIGYIPQEPILFPTKTIKENLVYSKSDQEDISLVDIERACKLAQIHDFIVSLPKGYDTTLADGVSLSGGQKQRIAIARALVSKKPPAILILDEATSALDSVTEKAILSSLYANLRKKCIMVVIAHRMETVKNADLIVVMEKGQIIEKGNHETLLSQPDSKYAQLVVQ